MGLVLAAAPLGSIAAPTLVTVTSPSATQSAPRASRFITIVLLPLPPLCHLPPPPGRLCPAQSGDKCVQAIVRPEAPDRRGLPTCRSDCELEPSSTSGRSSKPAASKPATPELSEITRRARLGLQRRCRLQLLLLLAAPSRLIRHQPNDTCSGPLASDLRFDADDNANARAARRRL